MADRYEAEARRVAHSLPPSDFGSHRAIMAFADALRAEGERVRKLCADTVRQDGQYGCDDLAYVIESMDLTKDSTNG